MKTVGRIARAGAALLAVVALQAAAQTAAAAAHISGAGREILRTQIGDGIYQFTTLRDSYVQQLNSVAVINADDVLVFDTNTRPSTARLIVAQIRELTTKPVRYVVNSHWHPDHWSGNEVYAAAFPGVEIIATDEANRFMHNVSPAWPARFTAELARVREVVAKEKASGKRDDGSDLPPAELRDDEEDLRDLESFVGEATALHRTYPTLTYVDHLTLQHGGRELRFMSVTGDAEGTTVLYLPREKVLLTGDAISYPIPYISPPPSRQARSLRELAKLDVDVIIPGHGPAFYDKAFLERELALLETVIRGVQEALQKGPNTLADVQQSVTAEALREQFTHNDAELDRAFRDRVKQLVKLAVREARDGRDFN